jgi:hypothetical protein
MAKNNRLDEESDCDNMQADRRGGCRSIFLTLAVHVCCFLLNIVTANEIAAATRTAKARTILARRFIVATGKGDRLTSAARRS